MRQRKRRIVSPAGYGAHLQDKQPVSEGDKMSDRIQITTEGGVARVTLNRPDKRNGLDLEMFTGLIAAGEAVMKDKSIRAVVLHGEGPAFCAGLDFAWFTGDPDGARKLLGRADGTIANLAQRVGFIWQEVPVPVIAALHGYVFGGGLQIALGADLRYVAADAQLSVMEIKWGLIPDMSITQTLPRVVAADVAKELIFTGRIVSGIEAQQLGLATRVCADPLATAIETAQLIATKSPDAIRAGKRLMNAAPQLTPADALLLETELQLKLIGGPNNIEAITANMAKRPPVFRDPA